MIEYIDNSIFENREFPFKFMPFRLERGHANKTHYHEFMEFVFFIDGQGEHVYQDYVSPINHGDVYIIEQGIEHSFRVVGDSLTGYNVLFHPAFLSAEFQMLSAVSPIADMFHIEPFLRQNNQFIGHLQLNVQEQLDIIALLNRLELEHKCKKDGYQILIKTHLIEMFVYLSRCYHAKLRKPLKAPDGMQNIIKSSCDFIAQHYAAPLTLDDVSHACGMSISSFTSKFKQFTGKTFLEYRNDIRLRKSKELLKDTNDKIITIANQVGFDDLSFFNKSFKQAFQTSPGKYRKNNNNQSKHSG